MKILMSEYELKIEFYALLALIVYSTLLPESSGDEWQWYSDEKTGCQIYDSYTGPVTFTWSGRLKNGKAHGTGVAKFYQKGKLIYQHEGRIEAGKYTGFATTKWPKDNKPASEFKGNFKDSKRTGKGTHTYSSGFKYVGDYKEDSQTGHGVFYRPNGSVKYKGKCIDGEFHGDGIQYFEDGARYEGEFKNNKYNGKGKYFYPSGTITIGTYINGAQNGPAIQKKTDGTFVDEIYINHEPVIGRIDGERLRIHPNIHKYMLDRPDYNSEIMRWLIFESKRGNNKAKGKLEELKRKGVAFPEKTEGEADIDFSKLEMSKLTDAQRQEIKDKIYQQLDPVYRENTDKLTLDELKKRAYRGYPESQYQLAKRLFNGEGLERDVDQALKWFYRAAGNEHVQAHIKIGLIYLEEGDVVPVNYVKADQHFHKALNLVRKYEVLLLESCEHRKSMIEAATAVLKLYEYVYAIDNSVFLNHVDRLKIDIDDSQLPLFLGRILRYLTKAKNQSRSDKMYKLAIANNSLEACAEYGIWLRERGDIKGARRYLSIASNANYAPAMVPLGLMCLKGESEPVKKEQAEKWLKRANFLGEILGAFYLVSENAAEDARFLEALHLSDLKKE